MPQELVIAVTSPAPLSETYLAELKAKAGEVAKRVAPMEVVICVQDGENSSHCLNSIAHEFLKMPDAAWLWLIKEDLQWEPHDLIDLVATKRPVIGCLTTICTEWPGWDVTLYETEIPDAAGVLLVPEVGGNGLLIHRTVFEKILDNPAYPLEFRDEQSWDFWHAFFQQTRVAFKGLSRLLREEHFFQWMCREMGIGIYCHSKVRIKRKGPNGELYPKEGQEPGLIAIPPQNAADWPYKPISGKILIALQYWDGDREQAYKLHEFITEISSGDYVVKMFCSNPALKYPQGPNDLAMRIMKEAVNYGKDIKAVLLMEADCVPVARDWIEQLYREWDRASGQGKMVLGHWQKESGGHINGNLMFDPRLASVIDLGDKPPRRPWDIAWPSLFEPLWARTGLIKNLYRMTNVTDEQIETPVVGIMHPVLIHGVRDDSAWKYAKNKMWL